MRRLFLLVAAVVLVDTAFYAAITPLLPHYSDELGLTKTSAGVLTASYAAGTVVGSVPGGWLSARWGVKPTLILGLAVMSVTSVVFAFGSHVAVLDISRFVQGFGGACSWAAGMAWLVGAAPRQRRGELIGSALAAAIIGVLLGPVLGGLATQVGPEPVFVSVGLVGVGLIAFAAATPGVPPNPGLKRPSLRGRPTLIWGFWLFMLPALLNGVIEVLGPLRLDKLGASGVAIGAVFLIAAAIEAVLSTLAGRASDRVGRLTPIRIGLAGGSVMAILLPLPGTAILTAAVIVGAIASLATFWAPAMALISDASEEAGFDQAIAFAVANLAWSAGHLVGGGGGGALAEATSDAVPYSLMALACALTLAGVSRARLRARA